MPMSMLQFEYRNKFICHCFGGGGGSPAPYVPPPPPPTNTPQPPGSDAFQRFQEIRQGLLTGQTQLIQPSSGEKLGQTKGTTVTPTGT